MGLSATFLVLLVVSSTIGDPLKNLEAKLENEMKVLRAAVDNEVEGWASLIKKMSVELRNMNRTITDLKQTVDESTAKIKVLQDDNLEKEQKIAKLEDLTAKLLNMSATCADGLKYGKSQILANSTMVESPIEKPPDTLIVASGAPKDLYVSSTEAISLSNMTACTSLPSFPKSVDKASGGLIGSRIVICGGGRGSTSPSANCYSLGPKESTWTYNGNLLYDRFAAASSVINGKLFITGGQGQNEEFLYTTEFYDLAAASSTHGPFLPIAVGHHCMVRINSTTVMLIGGRQGNVHFKSTFFYSTFTNSFEAGPSMHVSRRALACGVLESGSNRYVVAAGGHGTVNHLAATEYLDLNNISNGWQLGPALPKAIDDSFMVSYGNSVLLVGGCSSGDISAIYSLSCVTLGCSWSEMALRLANPRNDHLAAVVPEEFFNCA